MVAYSIPVIRVISHELCGWMLIAGSIPVTFMNEGWLSWKGGHVDDVCKIGLVCCSASLKFNLKWSSRKLGRACRRIEL